MLPSRISFVRHCLRRSQSLQRAFTLLEILVATAVLVLLLGLTFQLVSETNRAIAAAQKHRGAATHAEAALDRFAADFSTVSLGGGMSVIVRTGNSTDSEIGFSCLSRPPKSALGNTWPRGALVSYGMQSRTENGVTYDGLHRWVARFEFKNVLGAKFKELSEQGSPDGEWSPVGAGVVRFRVSYVLDDGSIVQDPPVYSMKSPETGVDTSFLNGLILAPGWDAVACSQRNVPVTGSLRERYVKSLIVAVAAVDLNVLALADRAGRLTEIHSVLGAPGANETPLQVWEQNVVNLSFAPLRENIRFYQRSIYIP
jgi:prepilin-type N-terminal cleavage/methylation domain-containing protein